jgi:hypothetical protein
MGTASPMRQVVRLGKYRLFHAARDHFKYPGLHLWTGRRHVQVWPLARLGRGSDQ